MTGNELKKLRLKCGLTQTELALLLGCAQKQISWWECRTKTLSKIKEIAVLKVLEGCKPKPGPFSWWRLR